jgi:outer membrane protein TolC
MSEKCYIRMQVWGKGNSHRFVAVMACLLLLFCGLPVHGQTSGTPLSLTPDTAVQLAIQSNLSLETARIALDIRQRKADYVWNQFIPSVSVTGNLSRDNWAGSAGGMVPVPLSSFLTLPPGVPEIYAVTPYSVTLPQWHVNGAFSASLDFSFALVEGMKSTRLDYNAGVISLEKAKLQIEQGIRKMYNSILLLEANVELLKETYANTQRQADIAEANYRAGLAPRLTMLQAQVAVGNMIPQVNDLENNLKILKGNFALFLGLSYDASLELGPVFLETFDIPMGLTELIQRAVTGKPDIQELQATIMTLQSQQKALTLQQYTPFLRLGWTVSSLFNPTMDPFKESWFNGDNWNKGGNFTITLGMSFNSFLDFTKEGQQRKDMEANIHIQNIRLAQTIRETELEIFSKLSSLEKNQTSAEAQAAAVSLAELAYSLTEEAYRAGLQDFQAVQSAALALRQSRLQLLTQQYNYLNDLIDLEYAIGVPFGTLSNIGSSK